MRYVRVQNNEAVEIYETPEGVGINDCFHPDLVKTFYQSDEAQIGWIFNPESLTLTAPEVTE
jgi:hypothetical protein